MFRCELGFCAGRCSVVDLVNFCGVCLDFAGYFVFVVVVVLIDGELVWLLMGYVNSVV